MISERIPLKRACQAIEIPSGIQRVLPAGTLVSVMQSLGSSYTVSAEYGYMFRIDARDADALGLTPAETQPHEGSAQTGTFNEQMVWDQLKTVYDPEIPVNIVDLGLIYGSEVTPLETGRKKIAIKMSMTAPGCGMGNVLKADVESKLARLPEVGEVDVEIVFEPQWTPARMSEAAKLQLGFDLDYGVGPDTSFPVVR
ncbi:MAG TPA: putative Fe-S cluster assembly protein SufT [Terriglobales bacterium]|nr:putative Fe-S cluster assembly protein SufT [Terriglobales bacterium]